MSAVINLDPVHRNLESARAEPHILNILSGLRFDFPFDLYSFLNNINYKVVYFSTQCQINVRTEMPQTKNFCVSRRPLLGNVGMVHICKLQLCELFVWSFLPSFSWCLLCCRGAAEPATARRSDRDCLSKERLWTRQRGSGLPTHAYRA